MCAVPEPGGPAAPSSRPRITPIQWVGLAILLLLLAYQLGFFRPGALGDWSDRGIGLLALVLAVTVHEYSHARVATWFGDDLPRRMGRLTLNPLAHLDLMGSLLFLLVGFGWGKPVQINPNGMRNPSLGWALSSVAGPMSNLIASTLTVVLVAIAENSGVLSSEVGSFIRAFITVNVVLAVFNLIPLPPLDGFGFVFGLAPRPVKLALLPLHQYGPIILLALLFLPNLIPGFPPIISTIIRTGSGWILGALQLLLGLLTNGV